MQQLNESDLQAELELAMLQINQLQEELEYYYLEYKQLKENDGDIKRQGNVFQVPALNILRKARLIDNKYTQSTTYDYNKEQQGIIESLQNKIEELVVENHQVEVLNNNLENKSTEINEIKAKLETSVIQINNFKTQVIEKEQLAKKQAELLESHKAKDSEIVELTEQRDNEAHWHQENKKWAEDLNEKMKQKDVVEQQQMQARNLNEKLLAKALIDLDDLRNSYREKEEQEKKLVNLIYELRNKLNVASKFYNKLQQEHPELLTIEFTD
ncbi:MAG: hypothetical protein HQ521_17510 [Bacteroidetes bacterium]|nr:hypothetical protein [Bacteroidota bacterium]